MELAAILIAEMEADPGETEGNIEDYRREIYVSRDKRAKKDTIKLENSIGWMAIWQADAGQLDAHLRKITARGNCRKAKQHKIILRRMMDLAARELGWSDNPIDRTVDLGKRKTVARGKVRELEALPQLRARLRDWASGKAVPGGKEYTIGPPRDYAVPLVFDLDLDTGLRPWEIFAVLLDDIHDLDTEDPYLLVTGTLVETKGKGTGGWIRKPVPKSENGWRGVWLSKYGAAAVRAAIKELEDSQRPNPDGLLFPSRAGTPRSPNNFNRAFRDARGTDFEWVTLRTLRRAVSTRVYERTQDGDAARRQLGNTKDVARTHYTDMPDMAPDHRSIIEELFVLAA
ncbi:site-specific integrase [Nocardia brasiliensis]|uniref:site-specific integrase n=1 Tax=Nocardia brasiliensis TaxID=37326 RepID=UPI002455B4D0|nr:site-specific integrase [Nocardia brasiliensis]